MFSMPIRISPTELRGVVAMNIHTNQETTSLRIIAESFYYEAFNIGIHDFTLGGVVLFGTLWRVLTIMFCVRYGRILDLIHKHNQMDGIVEV